MPIGSPSEPSAAPKTENLAKYTHVLYIVGVDTHYILSMYAYTHITHLNEKPLSKKSSSHISATPKEPLVLSKECGNWALHIPSKGLYRALIYPLRDYTGYLIPFKGFSRALHIPFKG